MAKQYAEIVVRVSNKYFEPHSCSKASSINMQQLAAYTHEIMPEGRFLSYHIKNSGIGPLPLGRSVKVGFGYDRSATFCFIRPYNLDEAEWENAIHMFAIALANDTHFFEIARLKIENRDRLINGELRAKAG